MRIAFFPMKEVKSVAMKCMLIGGPAIEDSETAGASHFLEHIVLDGTESYPSKYQFANILEELGISYNGYTSTQEIGFEFDVPYTNIREAISILHEVLFKPLFSSEIIEKERKVILEEMQDRSNSPDFLFYYTCQEARFKDPLHPLSRKVIGTKEVIASVSQTSLRKLYERIFIPSNIVLCLTGNINIDETAEYVEELFSKYTASSEIDFPKYAEQDLSEYLIKTVEHEKFNNVYAALTFPSYPSHIGDKKECAMELFSALLGGTRTSRLFQDVREKEGLVYSISSQATGAKGVGEFMITFESDKSNLDRILEIIAEDIDSLLKTGFSSMELTHMKNYMRNRRLISFSSPWRINQWILDYLFEKEDVLFPEQLIEVIDAVEESDINDAMRAVFQVAYLNLVMMGKLDGYEPKVLFR